MSQEVHPIRRLVNLDSDGRIVGIKREQVIDDALIKNLAESRSKRSWHGEETLRVASVPLALVESLRQQGIDLMSLDAKELMAMLKSLGYDKFIAYGGNL
jgi:hypothetical protein